jgi:hypothetical protein
MLTTVIGRKGRGRYALRISEKTTRAAAVLGALVLLSVAVNTAIILASNASM